jgi:hypothetical protein
MLDSSLRQKLLRNQFNNISILFELLLYQKVFEHKRRVTAMNDVIVVRISLKQNFSQNYSNDSIEKRLNEATIYSKAENTKNRSPLVLILLILTLIEDYLLFVLRK